MNDAFRKRYANQSTPEAVEEADKMDNEVRAAAKEWEDKFANTIYNKDATSINECVPEDWKEAFQVMIAFLLHIWV